MFLCICAYTIYIKILVICTKVWPDLNCTVEGIRCMYVILIKVNILGSTARATSGSVSVTRTIV